MLFNTYGMLETKPTDGRPWVAELPEDDEEAMALVLAMVHAKSATLQPSFELKMIYQIMIIVDKYDLYEVIRPYAAQWIMVLEPEHGATTLRNKRNPVWATYVAWRLGNQALFEKGVWWVIRNSGIDHEGGVSFLHDGWSPLGDIDHLGPHDLAGKCSRGQVRYTIAD